MPGHEILLQVNKQPHFLQAPSDATLLEVLRGRLGMGGPKYGCGVGMCGACTVLIDGQPASACITFAFQVQGKEITTIEGLTPDGELHPVQQAFLDEAGFQCAFCTPGFILSTVALLNENPHPSPEEIKEYLNGNLCRCGSYENILKAVQSAENGSH